MWEIDISLQALSFLRSMALGMIYCLMYDILRTLRKNFDFSDIAISLQDIIYFLIISPVTFIFLLATTNGEVRFYIIFGIGIGFLISRATVSKILLLVSGLIISFLKKIFSTVRTVFSKTFRFIEAFLKKAENSLKKGLKKP